MKNQRILSTLIVGLFSGHIQAQVEVANAALDYQSAPGIVVGTTAPTAPPDGWEYLTSTAGVGGTEIPLPAEVASAGGNTGFAGASNSHILGDQNGGAQYEIFTDGFDGNGGTIPIGNEGVVGTDLLIHPGGNAANAFTIARYTISAADIANGTFATITGSFRDLAGRPDRDGPAESITAEIFLNSNSLFSVTGGATAQGTPAYLEQATGSFNLSTTLAEGDVISFVVGNNGNVSGDETALQASIDLATTSSNLPPTITAQPVPQDLFVGDTLNLSVAASGTAPFTYQWRRDFVDIDPATNPSATTAAFSIASIVEADAASYDVVVTNASGTATSMAALVTVEVEFPAFVTQPVSQVVIVGNPIELFVEATGSDLQYQWSFSPDNNSSTFVAITGETNPTFTIPVSDFSDTGFYDCTITNSAGQVFSDAAEITVRTNDAPISTAPDPVITSTTVNRQIIFEDVIGGFVTDPDGDPLTIILPSTTSANGAILITNGTRLAYLPTPDSTITGDTFTVDVTDGFDETVSVNFSVDVDADAAGAPIVIADAALDYVREVDATPGSPDATPPTGWRYYQIEQNALDDLAFDFAVDGTNLNPPPGSSSGDAGNEGFEGQNNGNIMGTQTNADGFFQVFDDGFNGNGNGALGNQSLVGADLLMVPPSTPATDPPEPIIFSSVVASYTISADDVANGSIATISGSFREQAGQGPDATNNNQLGSATVSLYINNEEVFTVSGDMGQLLQSDGVFSFTTPSAVAIGDVISFVVDRQGTNDNMTNGGDEVALNARIELSGDPIIPTGEIVIDSCGFVGTGFQVVVSGLTPGVNYFLGRSNDLEDGFPITVGSNVTGTGSGDVFTDPTPPTGPDARAFYRVFEVPGT